MWSQSPAGAGKCFIGGLSWQTTDQHLRTYFENFGAVAEAFVSYDRSTGRPRGFGFVVFEDPAVADKVVSLQHTIDRREVEAKRAVPKMEQPLKPAVPACSTRTKKVFVGGLAPTVDEKALRAYFELYGQVEDAVVMFDHTSQRPRGFGFITFSREEAVEQVFTQGAIQSLHDKPIEIKRAVPREQMSAVKTPRASFARSPLASPTFKASGELPSNFFPGLMGLPRSYSPPDSSPLAGSTAGLEPLHIPAVRTSMDVPGHGSYLDAGPRRHSFALDRASAPSQPVEQVNAFSLFSNGPAEKPTGLERRSFDSSLLTSAGLFASAFPSQASYSAGYSNAFTGGFPSPQAMPASLPGHGGYAKPELPESLYALPDLERLYLAAPHVPAMRMSNSFEGGLGSDYLAIPGQS